MGHRTTLYAHFMRYINHFRGLPFVCWQAIVISTLEAVAGGMAIFLSLYFVQSLHFSIECAALMISCFGCGKVLGGLLGGRLVDHMPAHWIVISGIALQACTYAALIWLKTPGLIGLTLLFQGIGIYAYVAANNAAVMKACAHHESLKMKAVNLLYSSANLGMGLSAVVVMVFARYGFHTLFGIASLLLTLIALYLSISADHTPVLDKITAEIPQRDPQPSRDLPGSRLVVALSLALVWVVGCMLSQLGSTYTNYIHTYFTEVNAGKIATLFALNSILIVLFQTPLLHSMRSLNRILLMGAGAALLAFGFYILIFQSGFWILLMSCIIYTLGEMIFTTMSQLLMYAHTQKKGQGIGLYQSINASSMIVGPSLGGLIYAHWGGQALWTSFGGLGLLCLLLCLVFFRRDSPSRHTT
jgi:predicted MFS family arabinose efflux permease